MSLLIKAGATLAGGVGAALFERLPAPVSILGTVEMYRLAVEVPAGSTGLTYTFPLPTAGAILSMRAETENALAFIHEIRLGRVNVFRTLSPNGSTGYVAPPTTTLWDTALTRVGARRAIVWQAVNTGLQVEAHNQDASAHRIEIQAEVYTPPILLADKAALLERLQDLGESLMRAGR